MENLKMEKVIYNNLLSDNHTCNCKDEYKEPIEQLIEKIQISSERTNQENCFAAAGLIIMRQAVSEKILMDYFNWGKEYVDNVLTFLTKNKIISPKRFFLKRKILVNKDYINKIITNYVITNESNKWITKALIKIHSNGDMYINELSPSEAVLFNIGDKWIIKSNKLNTINLPISSELCFVEITERVFYEDRLEIHGEIVSCDGVFYQ